MLNQINAAVVLFLEDLNKLKENPLLTEVELLPIDLARLSSEIVILETPNGTKITLVEDSPDKEVEIESYDEEKFIKENPELHEQYNLKLAEYKITKKEIIARVITLFFQKAANRVVKGIRK